MVIGRSRMSVQFYDNLNTSIKKVIILAKKKNKETALILNTTVKSGDNYPILLPIKKTLNLICLGITISEKKGINNILKKIDGKVDYILFDIEQKNKELLNLQKIIIKNIYKSKILNYKTNDYTADSAYMLLEQLADLSKKKKIVIMGSGNIGSKLALKIVERGSNVFISKRIFLESMQIANAINIFKPKACVGKAYPEKYSIIAKNCELLICFSSTPIINKKIIEQMKSNSIIIDGGIGTVQKNAIKIAHQKKIKIIRLDVRAGLSGMIAVIFETRKLLTETSGFKKIANIEIVAGGFYGKLGDVIVDSITNPREVIGIADGMGGVLRNQYSISYKNKIQKINEWIKNN